MSTPRRPRLSPLPASLLLLACRETPPPAVDPLAPAPTPGVVAADHRLASEAGAEVLRQGGNAADAAVAAALAAGVVQPQSSGLGGGGFAVGVRAGESPWSLDFREVAPGAAHARMFLDDAGAPIPDASEHGGLAVAVPGEARGLADLVHRHGRLSLAAVAAPAIRLAREGFPVGEALATAAGAWSRDRGDGLFPTLFDGVDTAPTAGTRVRRARLATTLEAWAASEGTALHLGPLAAELAAAVGATGGVLTAADLAAYAPVERAPLTGTWRGLTIVTMPPPSSGGVVLLQALDALQAWPPLTVPADPADTHRTVQALQHAFADRARWMGDPGFVDVPVDRLLAPARVDAVRAAVTTAGAPPDCRTLPPDAYGLPVDAPADAGTHHISVMDGEGMAVALTTTVNTSFGSGVVDPTTGVLLNDQMDDFSVAPGVPNAFGLVGDARNAVAPGKRPLSSMSPTVVVDATGAPVLVVGGSGGPRIITATLQVTRDILEAGLSPADALALPRFHHQWLPDELRVEAALPSATRDALAGCGYRVRETSGESAVQVVWRSPDGRLVGASDPRKGGAPVEVTPR